MGVGGAGRGLPRHGGDGIQASFTRTSREGARHGARTALQRITPRVSSIGGQDRGRLCPRRRALGVPASLLLAV